MRKEIDLVREFHEKFQIPLLLKPSLITKDRSDLRFRLMKEEVEEYLEGVENKDLPNIAKELADILYATYGTIIEHGLQDQMEEIFEEVHKSNMTKKFHLYKMIKDKDFKKADIKRIL